MAKFIYVFIFILFIYSSELEIKRISSSFATYDLTEKIISFKGEVYFISKKLKIFCSSFSFQEDFLQTNKPLIFSGDVNLWGEDVYGKANKMIYNKKEKSISLRGKKKETLLKFTQSNKRKYYL